MMKRLLLVAITAAIQLVGCQTAPPAFTEAERAETVAEIRSARDAYFVAATELDADALVAFWDRDFIHVSNANIVPLTPEVLREAWKPLGHIKMDVTSDRVVALSPDAGYTVMTASYVVFDGAGVAVDARDWAGTHIWVRRDGEWKVQAVHEGRPVP
jgi:hypothetical protein